MEQIKLPFLPNQKRFWLVGRFHLILVCVCLLMSWAMAEPFAVRNVIQDPLDFDVCKSSAVDRTGPSELLLGGIAADSAQGTPRFGLHSVCHNSDSFCFPSTLPGFVNEGVDGSKPLSWSILHNFREPNMSWSSRQATYVLLNGKAVSCSLNLQWDNDDLWAERESIGLNSLRSCTGPYNESAEMDDSRPLDGSSSPNILIKPPLLDWGPNQLYVPSLASLIIANLCNDSVLHVFEPSSADPQFFTYDFNEFSLGPGESASMTFVFLPRWVGLSSAHVVLQTSFGGFLVRAKGLALEPPYESEPLIGLSVSTEKRLKKNLSLFSRIDDTLYVEEVQAWIEVSTQNISHLAHAVCSLEASHDIDDMGSTVNVEEWLTVKSEPLGLPVIRMKPYMNWEVSPNGTQPIMEIDFFPHIDEVFGALYVQLRSSVSDEWSDTVIAALDVDVHSTVAYSSHTGSISVRLEMLRMCDAINPIQFVLSLKNDASHLLKLVEVGEVTDSMALFQVKYIRGLILFPGVTTHVAMITYDADQASVELPPEVPKISSTCKLLIVTNDSYDPQIEIPCQDILAKSCPRSHSGSHTDPFIELQAEHGKNSGNTKSGSLDILHASAPVFKVAEADEFILRKWRSQGTVSGISVLEEREVLFSTIQVGTYSSKWITVNNPSQYPVLMQLVLNSGAIIDQCRDAGKSPNHLKFTDLTPKSSLNLTAGFSIPESAILEAYVHPHGKALFGPIFFHPSKRCVWKSSAVIRNNISGVEWLHLHGIGGALSLALLEGDEPVRNLEFSFAVPVPLNASPPEILFLTHTTGVACSQPVLKDLVAENTGDLPMEVIGIEVSGVSCGSDGFMVHSCKGFALAPGESRKLVISYQSDFSASVVHRDLELTLSTGALVIPMKAKLPLKVLSICRKSVLLMLMKKIFLLVVFAVSVILSVFCCILPLFMNSSGQEIFFRSDQKYVASIRTIGKPARVHRNQKHYKSVKEVSSPGIGFLSKCTDYPNSIQELEASGQPAKLKQVMQAKILSVSEHPRTTVLSPPSSAGEAIKVVESSIVPEVLQNVNLTVKTEKERGRRRRRRPVVGSGFTGKCEPASSQSGNSTPSSPLSPAASFTPKRTPLSPDIERPLGHPTDHLLSRQANEEGSKNMLAEAAANAKRAPEISKARNDMNWLRDTDGMPVVPRQPSPRPILLPSATFPGSGYRSPSKQLLASTAPVALLAKAPGSEVGKDKMVKKEISGTKEEFTYDIWGNHFPEFHLLGRSKEGTSNVSDAFEGASQSFFARGPQSLINKPLKRSVPLPGSPTCDGYSANQMTN